MTVSLKQMADSIEQIRSAMQRVEAGQHRHWISPYWDQSGPDVISPVGQVKTFTKNFTRTKIQILNPSSNSVSVTLNVFGRGVGGSLKTAAKELSLDPRSVAIVTIGELDIEIPVPPGWLDILATGPIFPSGHITDDATPEGKNFANIQLQTVGFSLPFYPVAEAQ